MSDVTEVQLEGVIFQLTVELPSHWGSQRTRNRKAFRAVVVNPETGATAYAGHTWRASDGRWYPGHISASRKDGPGHETPEACALDQLRFSTKREEREARAGANRLVSYTNRANGLRAVQGLEPLTIDDLLTDARKDELGRIDL